jgi:hypothetical protein
MKLQRRRLGRITEKARDLFTAGLQGEALTSSSAASRATSRGSSCSRDQRQ